MKSTIKPLFCVAALLASTVSAFAADHKVEIKSFKFSPATLSVAVGDTVTFTNMDGAPHTATSAAFDTGTLTKGKSGKVTIGAAGSFSYKCNFHSTMKGTITAK